jgi:hypothetical protein
MTEEEKEYIPRNALQKRRIEEARQAQVRYLQQHQEPWPPLEYSVPRRVTFMRTQHFWYKQPKRVWFCCFCYSQT